MDINFRTLVPLLVLAIGLILVFKNIYFGEFCSAIFIFSSCLTAAACIVCWPNFDNQAVIILAAITTLIGWATSFGTAMSSTEENGVEYKVANQLLQQDLCVGKALNINRIKLLGACTLEQTAIAGDFLANNAMPRGADPITKFSYDAYGETKGKRKNNCTEMLKEVNKSCRLNSASLEPKEHKLLQKLMSE